MEKPVRKCKFNGLYWLFILIVNKVLSFEKLLLCQLLLPIKTRAKITADQVTDLPLPPCALSEIE